MFFAEVGFCSVVLIRMTQGLSWHGMEGYAHSRVALSNELVLP